jgi:hypothetical protein
VAVSGNTAIVGSLQGNNYGDRSGSAYIFQDDGSGNWIEVAKLIPSDGIVGVGFGHSVAIAGDIAIVGALTDDAGQFSGAAFAFRRKGSGDWVEFAKLTASDAAAGDHFGNDIAIFENTALIGAWVEDNSGGIDAGSAYVFDVTVPEPSSIGILATGIAAMFLFRLRAYPCESAMLSRLAIGGWLWSRITSMALGSMSALLSFASFVNAER